MSTRESNGAHARVAAILRETSAADERKVREARRRQELDRKLKGMIREIVWQFVLLCVIPLWETWFGRPGDKPFDAIPRRKKTSGTATADPAAARDGSAG